MVHDIAIVKNPAGGTPEYTHLEAFSFNQ